MKAFVHREAPLHLLMIGVMAGSMAAHSALASLAGAALLVAVSVPCAALSRRLPFLLPHVLDLWAMALVILAFVPWAGGHHAASVPAGVAFAGVAVAWAAVRLRIRARGTSSGLVGAGLTGLGLAVMAIACAL